MAIKIVSTHYTLHLHWAQIIFDKKYIIFFVSKVFVSIFGNISKRKMLINDWKKKKRKCHYRIKINYLFHFIKRLSGSKAKPIQQDIIQIRLIFVQSRIYAKNKYLISFILSEWRRYYILTFIQFSFYSLIQYKVYRISPLIIRSW